MNSRGLVLIDGSFLFASIGRIKKGQKEFENRLLDISKLSDVLMRQWGPYIRETVRVSYYFKKKDKRIKELLLVPKIQLPRSKGHWGIIECGEPIRTVPENEIQKLSARYRDAFARAEKGLDMRIACDALSTAAMGRISDFVFMINDRDYWPLMEAIQRFGCCTYLTTLDGKAPHKMLLDICDYYIDFKALLEEVFVA